MIRAIGITPAGFAAQAPAPTSSPSEPKPVPPENGDETPKGAESLAFKGISIKNARKSKATLMDFVSFLKVGNAQREIKCGNMRSRLENNDVYTWDVSKASDVVMGKTKEAEDVLYKDLVAHKDMISGVEIHKIDDWA